MSKLTKSDLNRKIERQETRIDRLVGMLAKKGFYDKLQKLDQSIFNDEPPHLRWAAIEEDGNVYLFAKKPFIDLRKWAAGVDEVEVYIGDDYDASNWQNSLIERDTAKELLEVDLSSELTGSDLTRSILSKQFMQACLVSDSSDKAALQGDDLQLIRMYNETDGKFISMRDPWHGCHHKYAVAVDNNRKPLTAADVGL